jgi:hypothetical protein
MLTRSLDHIIILAMRVCDILNNQVKMYSIGANIR